MCKIDLHILPQSHLILFILLTSTVKKSSYSSNIADLHIPLSWRAVAWFSAESEMSFLWSFLLQVFHHSWALTMHLWREIVVRSAWRRRDTEKNTERAAHPSLSQQWWSCLLLSSPLASRRLALKQQTEERTCRRTAKCFVAVVIAFSSVFLACQTVEIRYFNAEETTDT